MTNQKEFRLECFAPSNIALVKYWGKHGVQLPSNPSISFTLKNSITKMDILYKKKKSEDSVYTFLFSGIENDLFSNKILKYIKSISNELPFLKEFDLNINSENTFPHSAGIASSASSMASLAYGLCLIEASIKNPNINQEKLCTPTLLKKASHLSRLGSGSACRSLYGGVVTWGEGESLNSTDEFAAPLNDLSLIFNDYCDSILLVDSNEKSVSSRVGHSLMETHPFKLERFKNAKNNMKTIIEAMKNSDFSTFGEIVEREALELHGLMMNSSPSFILMKPKTLEIIQRIRDFRKTSGVQLYFTLDAGPNPHLLYKKSDFQIVQDFIQNELLIFCEDQKYINDEVGTGPSYKFYD